MIQHPNQTCVQDDRWCQQQQDIFMIMAQMSTSQFSIKIPAADSLKGVTIAPK